MIQLYTPETVRHVNLLELFDSFVCKVPCALFHPSL